jgi:glycosidase
MNSWIKDAVFYQIYPLGLCGAPHKNGFSVSPVNRISKIEEWIDPMLDLGINAIYLGPVFDSSSHGYDTADYRMVDRRLGTNSDLKNLSEKLHKKGIRLVLDAVFHHCGRDFAPFRDLLIRGSESRYRGWFSGVNFSRGSPFGDSFTYDGWNGHQNLVKFNSGNLEVREYLFDSVRFWFEEFGIDGLRLDAADSLDFDFMHSLSAFCRNFGPDFWLMGEVIHGDYRRWVRPEMLDSVTNYEVYKGLWSSHNDSNYFEIAYSLNRQFGPEGIYRDLTLYNFADNHDVDRIVTKLKQKSHLYPLYILLFTVPGVPSIYYGSEWEVSGVKIRESDWSLRPELNVSDLKKNSGQSSLREAIMKIGSIRKNIQALRCGSYRQLLVGNCYFAFAREAGGQKAIVCVNSSGRALDINITIPQGWTSRWKDLLNGGKNLETVNGSLNLKIYPSWGSLMVAEN